MGHPVSLRLSQTISQTNPNYLSNYPKRSLNYPRLSLRLSQTVSTNADFSKYEECQKTDWNVFFFFTKVHLVEGPLKMAHQ